MRAAAKQRIAPDGIAAAAIARDWTPDVVLLDIGLPGKDGYEVARELRHNVGLKTATVALTGHKDDEVQRENPGSTAI